MDQVVENIFLISFVYKNEAQEKSIANISGESKMSVQKFHTT